MKRKNSGLFNADVQSQSSITTRLFSNSLKTQAEALTKPAKPCAARKPNLSQTSIWFRLFKFKIKVEANKNQHPLSAVSLRNLVYQNWTEKSRISSNKRQLNRSLESSSRLWSRYSRNNLRSNSKHPCIRLWVLGLWKKQAVKFKKT